MTCFVISSFVSAFIGLSLLSSPVHADIPHYSVDDHASVELWESGIWGPLPNQTLFSTDVHVPQYMIHKFDHDRMSPGSHIFLSAPVGGQDQSPLILSAKDLSVVYVDPTWNGGGTLNYQQHNNQNFLTFWTGKGHIGWGAGGCILLDDRYHVVKNITTNHPDFEGADNHEFELTSDGGALINVYYKMTPVDTTSVPNGTLDSLLHNSAFQEVDIETNEPRFTWIATDHFSLNDSFNPFGDDAAGGGWDWFHMNSIQKTPEDNYLISARHLCMLALVNGTDGNIIWRLGGKNNDFEDLAGGNATNFCFQHNARFVDEKWTEITLFDNHAMHADPEDFQTPGCEKDCSRALRLKLDYDAMTVDIVQAWSHPQSVQAWAQGGIQALPGGGAMIGWGTVPSFTEMTADGETVLEVQLSPWETAAGGRHGANLYRVYKQDYKAFPTWGPRVAVDNGTAYVSWNGATEVDSWEVWGGADSRSLARLDPRVPRAGFETAIDIRAVQDLGAIQIVARDRDGNELGSTDVVDAQIGTKLSPEVQLR